MYVAPMTFGLLLILLAPPSVSSIFSDGNDDDSYHLSRDFEGALPPPPQGALQHGVPLLPPLVRIVPPDRVRVLLLQLERDPGIVHLRQQFKSTVRKIEELDV